MKRQGMLSMKLWQRADGVWTVRALVKTGDDYHVATGESRNRHAAYIACVDDARSKA